MKYYHIKPNGTLHEAMELEYNRYQALLIGAEETGDEAAAEVYRDAIDRLAHIQGHAFTTGLTGREVAWLKEEAAARAIRQDFQRAGGLA
jgi:hypothetical protein